MRKKIIIGNWKMYKTMSETKTFLVELKELLKDKEVNCDFGIASSFTNLSTLLTEKPEHCIVSAQNCHFVPEGAFTGEVSIKMLEDLKVSHVLIGHSERRTYFNETDETINQKLKALLSSSKIVPVFCCGETLEEYEGQKTKTVIESQITNALKDLTKEQVAKLVIAYEPIWAIGTGKTASVETAQTVCSFIREVVAKLNDQETADAIRIQYGGSVKPDNIKNFLAEKDIDGALVGSAALKASDFVQLLV